MDPHEKYINGLATSIYEQNELVGWWDDPDRCLFTCLQLVSTEVAEATEGDRKNLMDDHLPEFKMEEVELADALIRTLDLGGKLGLTYDSSEAEVFSWCVAIAPVAKQHLGLNRLIVDFALVFPLFEDGEPFDIHIKLMNIAYSDLIKNIIQVAHNRGFSLFEALEKKVRYNKNRSDHKRENREKENGKKY